MVKERIKLFAREAGYSETVGQAMSELTAEINEWLEDHPDIEIRKEEMQVRGTGTESHSRLYVVEKIWYLPAPASGRE